MRPAAGALTTFEVAVARGGAALPRFQHIGIHGEAHAATRFSPLETRRREDAIESFGFGQPLHQAGHRALLERGGFREVRCWYSSYGG